MQTIEDSIDFFGANFLLHSKAEQHFAGLRLDFRHSSLTHCTHLQAVDVFISGHHFLD